ncbi:MAG: hypothetical protein XD93_1196, partial [candidate division WS6 bacterium 34_10]
PGSNWGPPVLQTDALPTELSWHLEGRKMISKMPLLFNQ